jgi:ribosome biogenesis GTPase
VNAETGVVLHGANNIFFVRSRAAAVFECRIKGKILKNAGRDYNPLAAGDEVCFLPDAARSGAGVLLSRLERKNAFLRWNKKGRSPQTIAANVDLLVCVASPASPPFRPRFLDRVLVAARLSGIPAIVCLNKSDQAAPELVGQRLGGYEAQGIRTLHSCAAPGKTDTVGLEDAIRGKRAVFVGQSGVGKTSLLNALCGAKGKVGEISEKYNRGRHTTVLACLETWGGGEIIDTPGIREFEICGIASRDLRFFFPEFEGFAPGCRLGGGCTHTHEPGCAVREAAENQKILFDRYESYCRIYEELAWRERKDF